MSDGIFRCGPWARSGDSYVNPITDFSSEPDAYPVNAPNINWTSDAWAMVWIKTEGVDFDSAGTVGLSSTVSMAGGTDQHDIYAAFYYQADQSFDVDFNWDIGSKTGAQWNWAYSTIGGDTDSDSGTPTGGGSGTETITLPASPLGFLAVGVNDQGLLESISLSISAP